MCFKSLKTNKWYQSGYFFCFRSFDLRADPWSPVVMDNLKCLSDHVSANVSVDCIDAYETLRKELLKSMKVAKKLKKELKLSNLEKEKLVVRLDESNKKNEFLRNQISS